MRRYCFGLAILSLALLGTSSAGADDQQIAQQIIERLQAEKQAGTLKGFSIDLQVDEGTVWLSGRVANDHQQARALDLARRVGGVKQVVNDLVISEPPSKPFFAARPTPVAPPAPAAPQPAPAPLAVSTPPQPESQPTAPTFEAVPIRAEPIPAVAIQPAPVAPPAMQAQQPVPAALNQQEVANLVAAGPAVPAPAPKIAAEQKPLSPAQSSVLNSVSKALVSAVHGGKQLEEHHASTVQRASSSQEVAAAVGAPIGSGVDVTAASARRTVVQAAQPVANVPQQVATAESLQPIAPAAPQMTAMVAVPYQPYQMPYMVPVYAGTQMQVPLAVGAARPVNYMNAQVPMGVAGTPMPSYMPGSGVGIAPARYDHPTMPGYAWPSYAATPNYAAVTYPKQYSPTAWPYIGPFYPYPQVPLGWRKVTLEWDDGWWFLDFKDRRTMYNK